MNDPHVAALVYRLEHGSSKLYDEAKPLIHTTPEFTIRVDNGQARFEMKAHYATVEEAREVVEPFIQEWELDVGLKEGHGEFEFAYKDAELIDRNPTIVAGGWGELTLPTPYVHGAGPPLRREYPAPPEGLCIDAVVALMYGRYKMVCQGRDTLAAAGYFWERAMEALMLPARKLARVRP